MLPRIFRRRVLGIVFWVTQALHGLTLAHVVPNMTVEADFTAEGAYTLRINVDPRTFLAADPTTLPPVPGSWYREQTPEQITATREKAHEYLSKALGLVFNGKKTPLPACEIEAIDGADNTPLTPETQEVHLLVVAAGRVPAEGGSFQIEFGKEANTSLILLPGHAGQTAQRPQVLFPGETSRLVQLQASQKKALVPIPPPQAAQAGQWWLFIITIIMLALLVQGWRLLKSHRHHHRGHRKPAHEEDVNN